MLSLFSKIKYFLFNIFGNNIIYYICAMITSKKSILFSFILIIAFLLSYGQIIAVNSFPYHTELSSEVNSLSFDDEQIIQDSHVLIFIATIEQFYLSEKKHLITLPTYSAPLT